MKLASAPTPNYDFFLKTDSSAYKGQWIALSGKKILAHGHDAQKVYQEAQRKYPKQQISLAKAPNEQMLVLRLSR